MTTPRLFAILSIFCCAALAWIILGKALDIRTQSSDAGGAVANEWGPPMTQAHPGAYYQSPGAIGGRALIRPSHSEVMAGLTYEPRQKGLLWYRTYQVAFHGEYVFENPTPIEQTIFVQFSLPSAAASYNDFVYTLNGKPTTANVTGREPVTEAVTLEPNGKATLVVGYKTRGVDQWLYSFGSDTRVQDFLLTMTTNFREIDFPGDTGSPTAREGHDGGGWKLVWAYPDEIGARSAGMAMPKVLNPGPTASRITFFAPVSLLFFFAVLVILCLLKGVNLHPMNFFFLSAGCFAFQLLFAYLVDLISIGCAFAVSATVSMVMVSGYLALAAGKQFAKWAALAQWAYMILFSYSFFFDGLTGLTITIGAIVTLGILMVTTAKIDWAEKFSRKTALTPPPIPQAAQ